MANFCLSSNGLGKPFAEMLSLAIDKNRPEYKNRIKILNLSNNNFGKDGVKALCRTLNLN